MLPLDSSLLPRVLVTGAAGFVGGWVTQSLKARLPGASVIGTHHGYSAPSDLVLLDVLNLDQASTVVQQVRPTCVIHLAAIAAPHEARRAPRRAWEVNLHGTMNVAEAVMRHAPSARFLFISSSEVYGGTFNAESRALDEDARLDPATPYAASKAAADLLVGQLVREGLNAIRLRPFNHTGPGQLEQYVIPAFASQIARIEVGLQEPILRVGNLDAQRDFLDVRDVAQAYTLAALHLGSIAPGSVLNIASGVARRIGDILEQLLTRAKVRIRIEQDMSRLRPNDTPVAIGDASRARALLNWRPQVEWEKTLDDVLNDYRSNVLPVS